MTASQDNLPKLVKSHIKVARLAYSAGEYTAALRNLNCAQHEIEIGALSVNDLILFELKKISGKVHVALGLFGPAESDFQAAQKIAQTSKEISEKSLFSIQRHLADCIRLRGRFDEADLIYRDLISLLDKREQPVGNQLAKACMGLAQVLVDCGKASEAGHYIDRAIQLIENGPGSKCFWYGRALIVKARLCCINGQNVEAHELFQRALNIVEPLIGADHPLALVLERKKNDPINLILAELKSIEKQLKDHELDSEHSVVASGIRSGFGFE